jgi:hypothetical protein
VNGDDFVCHDEASRRSGVVPNPILIEPQ